MSKGQRIPITVEFLATIQGMDEVVGKIQNGMKNSNFDFLKNLKAAKLFDNYKNEYKNFLGYIKDNSINPLEAKDAIKSGNNIVKMFRDIKLQYGDLSNVSMEMAKKFFPEAFSVDIEKAQKYIKDLEADVEKLSKKKIDILGAQTGLEKAKKKLEDIKAIKIASDFSKPIEDANNELEETKKKLTDLRNNSKKLSEAKGNTKAAKRALTTAKTNYTKTKNRFDAAEKGSPEAKALKQQLNERQKIREEADAKYNATLNKQKTIEDNLEKGNIGNLTSEEQAKAKELTTSIREQEAAVRKLNDAKDNAPQTEEAKQKLIDDQTTAYDNQLQKVNQLKTEIEKLSANTGNLEGIKKSLSDFGIDASNIQNLEDAKEVLKELENADTVALDEIRKNFVNMGVSADQAENLIEKMRAGLKGVASTSKDLDKAAKEVEQLRNQVLQFFSIGNAIQLFKRMVHSAFNTVKELDKTMTETAVVTDFTVGDMWSQLPRYSKSASELGVSINSAYQAETLYYQQGLKTNQVIGVSTETLKMARIAGMEAVDATNMMTAALRGFNMEVNEMNAQRVNDVYSKLAAITAADTREIGVAMSKTASIAKSANMEFETTSALLSQIIETTREAPETAGTAMKTIIARFTEVKKLISEGQLTGSDEEGEIIDVNKIDTALKTVGLSLTGFMQGTEGIDDIFLKLAEKWGTLDIAIQRYIATQAAGSRQQSRFLAMMGDYERTMELVGAANNSAGASQKQFSKTLESMETKLAKLKNAWNTFAMGLANNKILKALIDTLTWLLNTINNIINAISGGNGIVKAILSIGLAFGGLKLGGAIFNKIFSNLGKTFTSGGKNAGEGFSKGFMGTIKKVFTKNFWVGVAPNASNFNTDTAVKALDNLKKAQNNLARATKIRNNAIKNNMGSQATQEALNKKVSSSEAACATATTAYGAALGLTNAQQALYNSMTSAGISGDVAALAIKNGLTVQEYNLMAATIASTAADEAEAKAKMKVALASFGVIGAKTTEEAVDKAGLLTRIKDLAIRLFSVKATNKMTIATLLGIGAKTTETGATIAATGAQMAFNAAIYACPLGWILLAILAVVGAIIGLVAAFKAASDEAKMENLSEQLEYFKDAAEEARNKIQEITDTKSSLDDLQDSFAGLSRGTKEWKAKLVEVNQKVLELINTYPILAKFLEKGSEGQLSIKDEGYDAFLDKQQKMLTNSLVSQSALTMQKQDLQNKMSFEEQVSSATLTDQVRNSDKVKNIRKSGGAIANAGIDVVLGASQFGENLSNWGTKAAMDIGGFLDSGWGKALQWIANPIGTVRSVATGQYGHAEENAQKAATGGLTQEQYTNFAAAAAEGGLSISGGTSEEEFRELYLDMGFDESSFDNVYSKMQALGSNFDELANSSMGLKTAQEDQEAALIEAIASENEGILFSEFAEQAKDLAGSLDINTLIQEEAAGITEGKGDLKKLYAEEVGGYYNGEDLYLDENYTQKMEISDDEMRTAIAAGRVNEDLADSMKNTIAELNRLQSELGQDSAEFSKLKRLISAEGQGMTQKDLLETESLLVKDKTWAELSADEQGAQETAINEYLGSIGTSLEALGVSAEQFYGNIMTVADIAAKADELLASKGLDGVVDLSQFGDLGVGAANALANSFVDVLKISGKAGVEELNNSLLDVQNTKFANDPEKAKSFIEAFSNVDLTSAESIERFPDILEEIGLAGDFSEEEMENLISSMYDTGKAVKTIDLEALQEKIRSTNKILKNINTGEQGRTFSSEDYEAIIATDSNLASKFQQDLDGNYVYISGAMEELVGALNENTSALLGESKKQIENKLAANDLTERMAKDFHWEDGIKADIKNRGSWSSDESASNARGYLSAYISEASEIDLSQLGIKNLSNETSLESLEDTEVMAILDALMINLNRDVEYQDTANGILMTEQSQDFMSDPSTGSAVQEARAAREDGNTEKTAASNAILTEAANYGVSEEAIKSYNKALDEYSKNQNDATEQTLDAAEAQIVNAIADKKAQQALKKTTTGIKNITEQYEDLKDISDQDIQKIGEQLGFDDMEVGGENFTFVKDNLQLINDAANGSIEAMQMLQDKLAEQYGVTINAETGNVDLGAIMDAEADVQQQAIEAMNALIKAGAFETEEVTVEQDGEYEVPTFTDGLITGFEKKFYKQGQTYTVIKPTEAPNIQKATGGERRTGGGGGGGGGKKEKWENPYDELYNLTEKANEALRQREKIERDYDRLLKNRNSTSKQILANSLQEIANLQKEVALQKQLQAGRNSQISKLGSETFKDEKGNEKSFSDWGVTKYASYDEKTGTITIDWDAINKITDTEKGAAVEEYISKLEELSEQFEETQDTIEDMEDIIREIQERGKTEYVDFEQRIYDALVAADQAVIDNLSEINDSINDSNARLLDSIQTAIDEQRQARERDEQRNDIEEKQRRLALLKSDTSGANALEIKALEEEIGDLQQSYTDSLVDDSLAQLQQQNDDAAEQRERQIEIMQNQLDYAAENGAYWEEVSNLLSTAFNPDGSLNNNSALVNLLKETEGFKALSEFGGIQWIDELIESWLVAQEGLANWKIEKAKQSKTGVQTDKGALTYDSKTGLWKDAKGSTYSTLTYDVATGQYKAEGYISPTPAPAPTPSPAPAPAVSEETYAVKKGDNLSRIASLYNQKGFNTTYHKIAGDNSIKSPYTIYTGQKLKIKHYKHGGLADFTGPAWMDGTKADPELVLKGQDTQNFIALKEILSDILSMDRTPSQNNRDNYFEIHIEVDKLENDYDVEQVAEKVKRIINEDARYRNVNAINVLR